MTRPMEAGLATRKQSPHLAQWIAKIFQFYTTSDSIYVSDAVVNRTKTWSAFRMPHASSTAPARPRALVKPLEEIA